MKIYILRKLDRHNEMKIEGVFLSEDRAKNWVDMSWNSEDTRDYLTFEVKA